MNINVNTIMAMAPAMVHVQRMESAKERHRDNSIVQIIIDTRRSTNVPIPGCTCVLDGHTSSMGTYLHVVVDVICVACVVGEVMQLPWNDVSNELAVARCMDFLFHGLFRYTRVS